MRSNWLKRLLAAALALALLAGNLPAVRAQNSTEVQWIKTDKEITADIYAHKAERQPEETAYQADEPVRVSIILEKASTVQAGYATGDMVSNRQAMAYSNTLKQAQEQLSATISGQVLNGEKLDVIWNLTLVGNLISANVPYGKIAQIEALEGVASVVIENAYEACVPEQSDAADPQMFASLGMVGSTLVWSSGYTGAGSRIAIIDTGTDIDHQSLDNGAYLYSLAQNASRAGMSYDAYVESLDLLDYREVAAVLPYLNIYERDNYLSATKLYLNEKHPFAVNYVDDSNRRLVVDHESDDQGNHGSHVAGIAVANRYIPSDGGYANALDTISVAGIAPDAQLITMKVFGYNGGAYDSDYMAAIEDAILLGCDAINLSLGTSFAGFTQDPYYSDLLEYLTRTDTVVVASAGNNGNWGSNTANAYLYSDDVNLDTVGDPGSLYSFLAVASVQNDGSIGAFFQTPGHTTSYIDDADGTYAPLVSLDTSAYLSGTEYDFVFIDGIGNLSDYEGMDLTGKVVFCSRGTLMFSEKANNAVSLGAVATIVYNDRDGAFGMAMDGYRYYAPCVSITREDSMAIRSAATLQTTANGTSYYTGTITIYGTSRGVQLHSDYYTMSDFSSWGVPGDLSLKPEITAPGGNIYSIQGALDYSESSDQYFYQSGTSMAAPAVTGMMALLAQYLRENNLAPREEVSVRKLAQSLLMSTAVPILEEATGNYYSLLAQGSGLARVDLAVAADSYILVEGQEDGKVKAELGDDPNRAGIYEFSFSIHNLTGNPVTYALSADLFCQGTFTSVQNAGDTLLDTYTTRLPGTATFSTQGRALVPGQGNYDCDLNGDGTTNAADADHLLDYLLGNVTALHADGDLDGDGILTSYDAHLLLKGPQSDATVTVPANGTVTVQVRLDLTAQGRAFLDANYANGTYVEAFVYAQSLPDQEGVAGTRHSIPVLAFYGNWSDARMFDYGTFAELYYGVPQRQPYLYNYNQIYGNSLLIDYGDGDEYYFGGNPYVDDSAYLPERDAFSSVNGSILSTQAFALLRNAGNAQMRVTNADTGEIYYQSDLGAFSAAAYHWAYGWLETTQYAHLGWRGTNASGKPLADGTRVTVAMIAAPEYYQTTDGSYDYDALGEGATLSTTMVIDNFAPEILSLTQNADNLTVTAQDNRHVAAALLTNPNGNTVFARYTPNQTEPNIPVTMEISLADCTAKSFMLTVYDYAGNCTSYDIFLEHPDIERGYFTMVETDTGVYYSADFSSNTVAISGNSTKPVWAAEFVNGFVFQITDDGVLSVVPDDDLNAPLPLCHMDPDDSYRITRYLDLAYNYADNTLYGLFYSQYNHESSPYLFAIDTQSCAMEVLMILPIDVATLAIDDYGNFYSLSQDASALYTYTLEDIRNDSSMTYVGSTGQYITSYTSLAWDHDADTLYWASNNIIPILGVTQHYLYRIDPKTAQCTILRGTGGFMVGLYIRPQRWENTFAPVDTVSHVTLSQDSLQTFAGGKVALTATVWPWYVSDASVTWSSSNEAVAVVSGAGNITGVSSGTAVITATSKLDPSKQASCTVTVESLSKTLNALVWDPNGDIWWSELDVGNLPNYTKLSGTPARFNIATATRTPDGTIYAASAEMRYGSYTSSLYTVDPGTFELTLVGPSAYGYTDLAPAPGMGANILMATYYQSLLLVDGTTGSELLSFSSIFSYDLVGITYAGSEPYDDGWYRTTVDWYFIMDTRGVLYLMGFMECDGMFYYLEYEPDTNGIWAQTGITSDTNYYSSLYYDGEYVYYACYNQADSRSTLYAMDVTGSNAIYTLGDFGRDVWPVGGLMELDTCPNAPLSLGSTHGNPVQLIASVPEPMTESHASASSSGSLSQSVSTVEEIRNPEETVAIRTPRDTVSGILTLEFDPADLDVISVTGHTEAFAWRVENGCITIAYAAKDTISAGTQIASVTFRSHPTGEHPVAMTHTQLASATVFIPETLSVHGHDFQATVTPATCITQGYTTYTCHCGAEYIDDHTDFSDHLYEDGYCTACGKIQLGDVNRDGTVDTTDAYLIVLYYNERLDLTQEELIRADVDGSGTVDTTDAYYIVLYYNERIPALPGEQD